jgi:hypothetical protein
VVWTLIYKPFFPRLATQQDRRLKKGGEKRGREAETDREKGPEE